MQDDLVDGLRYLVEQGIADPKRACLWGGSYGGYATLYGVARDPDLWRCGVAYVAVSDIGLLFDTPYSDTARSAYRFLDFEAKVRIGDPERDRAQFDRTSAVKNAASIKAPLFLAYGSDDQRVPLVHGDRMRSALDAHGKRYEWVVYPGEGHGFNKDENRKDFYTRALDFLIQETQPR
jgi:dipeptidyl aminopeptidase/acylaminoacyl peptidase